MRCPKTAVNDVLNSRTPGGSIQKLASVVDSLGWESWAFRPLFAVARGGPLLSIDVANALLDERRELTE